VCGNEEDAVQLIKKYANRKLYHTNRKQYITLEGIAQLVQGGDSVQVLDNETGDDITASTLAQVVLLARRGGGRLLSTNVLTGLIQTSGETIGSLRRAIVTSLGGVDLVELEIVRRIEALQAGGMIDAKEAGRMQYLLLHAASKPAELALLPTHSDIDRLKAQLDDLTKTVEQLVHTQKPSDNDDGS
jgi:polyhydroxyalkanoate synthesis repressor PhaR